MAAWKVNFSADKWDSDEQIMSHVEGDKVKYLLVDNVMDTEQVRSYTIKFIYTYSNYV